MTGSGVVSARVRPPTPAAPAGARRRLRRREPAAAASPPAIQLHNSYLVAQSDDGLVIIDQHALHERIMYEELLARVSRGPLESQRLLIPQVIEASADQIAMLEQIQPLLGRLGIEVSPFGPGTVAVHAFPSFLGRLDPGEFVRELLERGEQELLDLHEEELLHEVLDMMACKAAVKAGDPLTPAEIEALLARRELVERSSNCPHGRPTTLRLVAARPGEAVQADGVLKFRRAPGPVFSPAGARPVTQGELAAFAPAWVIYLSNPDVAWRMTARSFWKSTGFVRWA